MSTDLENRLERAGDALPSPTEDARSRARAGALAAATARAPEARRGRFRHPRRTYLLGVATALAFAVVATVALVAPWEGRSPLATERALAAIGALPVVHAVVESTRPFATIVDLSSGEERAQLQRTEYWYEGERGLLRARTSVDGELLTEVLQTRDGGASTSGPVLGPPREPRLDPALAGFASRYREALESGEAEVVGETSVDGRDAVLLRIAFDREMEGRPVYEEVAVDAESYRPLRFRFRWGESAQDWWRVVAIETIARDERHFRPPAPSERHPQAQTGSDERVLSPIEAAAALERPAVWPGEIVDGIELTKIEVMKLTTLWNDGRETEGRALEFQYGSGREAGRSARWLEIREAASLEEAPRFGSDLGPAIPPGKLQLFGFGDLDGSRVDLWLASLKTHGMYVTLESPERDVVLAAARALAPMG